MAPWDEVPPGSTGTGVPQIDPKTALFAAMLSKFGRPPAQDGPVQEPQQTPAITPLANMPGAPGVPSTGMPAGVPGVSPTNLPVGTGAPQSRPLPEPNSMLGGSFAFPNKQARNAAVVSTGIENMSEAIHNFKVEKDQNEFTKAKNTWDLYQKAAAVNPETGQPVDPHTMAILAKDPKIVKGWEKYLKMEFPREAGAPDPKTGKPTQGPPQIPAPQAPAAAQSKALIEQRQLEQLRAAQGETGGLTPAEAHKAALLEAGILPKAPTAKDLKEMDKIDQEIATSKTQAQEHEAQAAKLTAELTTIPIENALKRQQILTDMQREKTLAAEAWKDYHEATKSKGLQEFVVAKRGADEVYSDVSKQLTKAQSQAMAARSKLGKAIGSTPDLTPEQEALQERLSLLGDFKSKLSEYQDDVEAQKITATDAVREARRATGLTSDYRPWDGAGSDWPDAKKLPEGMGYPGPNGEVLGVVEDGKWVAP